MAASAVNSFSESCPWLRASLPLPIGMVVLMDRGARWLPAWLAAWLLRTSCVDWPHKSSIAGGHERGPVHGHLMAWAATSTRQTTTRHSPEQHGAATQQYVRAKRKIIYSVCLPYTHTHTHVHAHSLTRTDANSFFPPSFYFGSGDGGHASVAM